ncbi:MAG: SpoIIIAH-like family protein [Christensenellales bacterium]
MVSFIKKYLVLVVVVVLFVGAFLLNLRTNAPKTEPVGSDAFEVEEAQETEYASGDYFATFRDDREQVRKLEMEYLDEVIAASASDDETLADAQGQKLTLVENMEKEFTVESLIKAKGFEDAAVTFHAGTVNVVVKADELSDKQVAQILEITKKETGEPAENIKVMTGK